MRVLFEPLYQGLVGALGDVFIEKYPADKVAQRYLKQNRKWGSHDRRLFAEAFYDQIRWWRRLLDAVEEPWTDSFIDNLSNRSDTQLVFTKVIEAWCHLNDVQLGKSVKQLLAKEEILGHWHKADLPRATRHSIPDWLDGLGELEFASSSIATWETLLQRLNTVAPVYLRTNTLKVEPQNLLTKLKLENVEAELISEGTLKLKKRSNVFLTKAFHAGLFEVQDLSSQKIAPEVGAQPGERIIDACAGAGGKSLHLAALIKNKGKVLALDVAQKKLDQLRERATRAGATCIEARLIESSKVVKRLSDSADRLLLDVPCSGLGVLRRNPDAKWKLSPDALTKLSDLQVQILNDYSKMLRVKGTLVYATCSILPSENEKVIESFLSQNENKWALEAQGTMWPEVDGPDGFFCAKLKKLA